MSRTTQAHVHASFVRMADACNATIADESWAIDDPRRNGAWILDYAPIYGGYEIRAYCASGCGTFTAERHVFSGGRRTPLAFVDWVADSLNVARVVCDARHPGALLR